MSIEVFPFEPKYQDAVWSLAEEILCREYGVQENLRGEADLADVAASYAEPDGHFMIALDGDQLVATGGILPVSGSDCELRRLYVRAEHRRQGVASTIVGGLLDFIRKRGYKRILLEVRPEMEDTIKGYGRYGFAPVTDVESLPRPGEFLAIRF